MNHYSFEYSLNSKELAKNPMTLDILSITSLSSSSDGDEESISMMAGMFHLRNKANRAGDLKSILGCVAVYGFGCGARVIPVGCPAGGVYIGLVPITIPRPTPHCTSVIGTKGVRGW